ncbi:hypothetical protein ITJ86_00085 [Winogradskyella sp. F6397]|uniref:DUF1737 domain-containing protein n=1 Tax=Winogradskyella marina TaxID=2785530 RepID=A0ABS0EFH3_9FLAO|nr:hypothetical protein [Winogradskyella marina]MBF8148272.1 hypothetical protein [Winogradskyella marina]
MEYKVIREHDVNELQDKINDLAADNWQVKGNLVVYDDYLTVMLERKI